nr:Arm DNA-binding domain-containing protein [Micavibrio aeruginosavorus]
MKLTNNDCKYAEVREKPYKLADGGGLYLLVKSNGSKHWRLKYRFLGKEKLLALGPYPSYRWLMPVSAEMMPSAFWSMAKTLWPRSRLRSARQSATPRIPLRPLRSNGMRGSSTVGAKTTPSTSCDVSILIFFPISVPARLLTLMRLSCWKCCGGSKSAAHWTWRRG